VISAIKILLSFINLVLRVRNVEKDKYCCSTQLQFEKFLRQRVHFVQWHRIFKCDALFNVRRAASIRSFFATPFRVCRARKMFTRTMGHVLDLLGAVFGRTVSILVNLVLAFRADSQLLTVSRMWNVNRRAMSWMAVTFGVFRMFEQLTPEISGKNFTSITKGSIKLSFLIKTAFRRWLLLQG